MNYKESYNKWLNDGNFDEETKKELLDIKDDEKEIEDRFYKDLEFGTGGLRGIIGAGSNRLNFYTVRKATQGLANYIIKNGEKDSEKSVAIAYDSRRMSPEFSREAALVLCANGIKAYVFESLRPTPELSFAVRELGCTAGIVITASHNPAQYNGYKVYWSDGCQVPPPRDSHIIEEVNKVDNFDDIKLISENEAKNKGLYNIIGKDIDDKYIEKVKEQIINKKVIKEQAQNLTIVYTPLHGTGNIPVRRVLKEVGFDNVIVVPEQELPDSNFSTISYPNPEDPKAFAMAIEIAKEKGADVIIGTDPDADRVGVVVKNPEGKYVILNGNMTGVLLTEYILSQKAIKGTLPSNGAIIKTIVTTKMSETIADDYNIKSFNVLTGFKFIGEMIKKFEDEGTNEFLFGFEESYGALAGTYARDKDAVVISMLVCEMAAYYKSNGMTLYDGLQYLYNKYGFFTEKLHSVTLQGIEGMDKIKSILEKLRKNPPTKFNGVKVIEARDYQTSQIKNMITGQINNINLPKSNVLYYVLADKSWFCIRPSGTEPKIKYYFGVTSKSQKESNEKIEMLCESVTTQTI